MSRIPKHAAKRDANEAAIVAALTDLGAVVIPLSIKGVPDLLVGWRGENFLLEVKAAKGELTTDQHSFFARWRGDAEIVRSVDDALKAIGADVY